jgi:hypothetical protein
MTRQDDDARWRADGVRYGWVMPTAPWWKRLLVIRHFRAAWGHHQVHRHNDLFAHMGLIPTGYDAWVLYGIARGLERAALQEQAHE